MPRVSPGVQRFYFFDIEKIRAFVVASRHTQPSNGLSETPVADFLYPENYPRPLHWYLETA
jgi:hypothetical protein